ncbi:homeobox-leucine zipper protein ATHB-52-like [Hevea brasiliensis]|uniref:homeobox-leucine zipper protein ATHB-52-like n=1 Tax=Hevea brasiliensis TaxID=3981 RepID=UPI0025EF50B4|nr:homeobox-leucine zipper protein ATHB-52-like [Hevea brasiliensis]
MSHFHQSKTPSHHSPRPSKKRLARDQLQILETSFNANQKLKAELKLKLACQLGLPPRQVAIWYQNKRARHKIEAKEHQFKNIQQELGNVLAENIRLEKEVRTLKYELNQAQEMLVLASTPPMMILLSGSTSDDDHANTHSPGNMKCWLDPCKFPGEEQHTYLTGPLDMLEMYTNNQDLLAESVKPNHGTNCRL